MAQDWFEEWKKNELSDEHKAKLIKPFTVHENGQVPLTKAVFNLQHEVNGPDRFAITALTENGKFLVGDMIHYQYKGVNIYTDKNNIILVNKDSDTVFVREYSKVSTNIAVQNPEEKQYILLYTEVGQDDSDSPLPFRWEACQGRTNAYDYIKNNAPIIDIDKSIILVEDVPVKDALTIREFVKHLKNSELVNLYDGFDIDEYFGSESM